MRFLIFSHVLLITVTPSFAQIEFNSGNYFPAELEFVELQGIRSANQFTDPEKLSGIKDGPLIASVGFESYEQKIYTVKDSGSLSIEVITLLDYRASYSLLTLRHNSEIVDGPPGDAFAAWPGNIFFCHGKRWVRISGKNVNDSLLYKVALSVSNRIGQPAKKFPSLISDLPAHGMERDSLQYFPGSESFNAFAGPLTEQANQTSYEMEIARAGYSFGSQSGILSLLKFPTPQIAENYYSEISLNPSSRGENETYLRRSGPLVCVLKGSISTQSASDILRPIQYSYSVKWINDEKRQSSVLWGIPVVILQSTVWSFFLVMVLCMISILAGAGLAGIRLLLRHFIPNNPLDDPKRTEITRLKLP